MKIEHETILSALSNSKIFSKLSKKELENIAENISVASYPKKSLLFINGDSCKRIYFIVSGRVKLSEISFDASKQQTLFLLGPGDIFDLIPLLDGGEHPYNAETLDDVLLLNVSIEQMRNWMKTNQNINSAILPYLGENLRHLAELSKDISLIDTPARLAKLLLTQLLPSRNDLTRFNLIDNLSQEEISNIVGSVRAVVSRHIQEFKRAGYIDVKRMKIKVKDLKAMVEKTEKFWK